MEGSSANGSAFSDAVEGVEGFLFKVLYTRAHRGKSSQETLHTLHTLHARRGVHVG